MSKQASKAEYKSAQAAQKFYSDSLNLLVAGKGSEFLEALSKYTSETQQTAQDIFESYQSDGKYLLHIASSTANVEVVEFAMRCSDLSFVNKPDGHGFTPLINATVAESSSIMSILIKNGADVNARNNDGATALHFAAGDGSVERMTLLCDAGCDLTVTSQAGSPISWAAGSGKADAIRFLAQKGCNVNSCGANGIPPVLMAAVAPNEECVVALIENGADVGHVITGHLTLLHICAEHGMGDAVTAILQCETGQKTALVSNDDGNQPIHLAAMGSHVSIISALAPYSGELPGEYFVSGVCGSGDLNVDAVLADGKRRLDRWMQEHSHPDQAPKETAAETKAADPVEPGAAVSDEDLAKAEQLKAEGNVCFQSKNFEGAIEKYSQALALNPHNHAVWSNRSACFMSMVESKEIEGPGNTGGGVLELKQSALKDAEMCRRMKPDWPKGCYRLAVARLALGMFEDSAVAAYEGCQLDDENHELKAILKKAVKLGQEEHRRNNPPK